MQLLMPMGMGMVLGSISQGIGKQAWPASGLLHHHPADDAQLAELVPDASSDRRADLREA